MELDQTKIFIKKMKTILIVYWKIFILLKRDNNGIAKK
jgi:hypothetical protein